MLRYQFPFDGKRFLLNKSTHQIHDLENESTMCHINDVNLEDIQMYDTENEIIDIVTYDEYDGCYWCLQRYNRDPFL